MNKKKVSIIVTSLFAVTAVTVAVIPFLRSINIANSNKIKLVVDLHGYRPSIDRVPTAQDKEVFNSTYYIAEEFMELNPDIEIVWARTKPVGGLETEVAQWFTTQIAGGEVPAIAFSWGTKYQERDWYLPLDEYLENETWEYEGGFSCWKDVYRDYLWDSASIKDALGRIVAVPITVYPGASTGYFYNKKAFSKVGIENVPTTWEEFKTDVYKLKDSGYTGVSPWLYFTTTTTFDAWVFQSVFSPSYAGAIFNQLDYDHSGVMDKGEQARACLENKFSPYGPNSQLSQEMYLGLYDYYRNMLESGWASIDYYSQWNAGTVGIREEGLWALPNEQANALRNFDYGVFTAPLVSTDTSALVEEVQYSHGPYHPQPDLSLNIMKAAIKGKPKVLEAAIKFLKFLSRPENVSLICVEKGGVLGAVKGTLHSQLINEFIKNDFPIKKECAWPAGFTDEQDDVLNRTFEKWVNGNISKDEFFRSVDSIQKKGANDFITSMGISTEGWNIG